MLGQPCAFYLFVGSRFAPPAEVLVMGRTDARSFPTTVPACYAVLGVALFVAQIVWRAIAMSAARLCRRLVAPRAELRHKAGWVGCANIRKSRPLGAKSNDAINPMRRCKSSSAASSFGGPQECMKSRRDAGDRGNDRHPGDFDLSSTAMPRAEQSISFIVAEDTKGADSHRPL